MLPRQLQRFSGSFNVAAAGSSLPRQVQRCRGFFNLAAVAPTFCAAAHVLCIGSTSRAVAALPVLWQHVPRHISCSGGTNCELPVY